MGEGEKLESSVNLNVNCKFWTNIVYTLYWKMGKQRRRGGRRREKKLNLN